MDKASGFFKILGFAGFAFCAALSLSAQDEGARIYRVEGPDFAIAIHGRRTVFPASAVEGAARGEGVYLERSGIAHTGPGTLLELQLIPSGTVVKLAENTSLVYNGVDETGKFAELGLLYGRIRVVAGTGAPGTASGGINSVGGIHSVAVRGGGVSVRTEGGDLGVDYVLEPSAITPPAGNRNSRSRPLFRAYAFRGGAELFPYGNGTVPASFGETQTLTVKEGECAAIDVSSNYTFAEKKALDAEIAGYWASHNFAEASSPLPMPDTAGAANFREALARASSPPPAEFSGTPPDYDAAPKIVYVERESPQAPARLNNRSKNLAIAVGFVLTAASVAVQGISYSQFGSSRNDDAEKYFRAAYAPLGLGLVCVLTGLLYNPSQPR